nr:HtaA domain-containing protein [Corynebacterium mendelii]
MAGTVTWGYKESTVSYVKQGGIIETLPGSVFDPSTGQFTFGIDNKKSLRKADGSLELHLNGGPHLRKYCTDGKCLMDQKLANMVVTVDKDGKTGLLTADYDGQDARESLYDATPVSLTETPIADLTFDPAAQLSDDDATASAQAATASAEITELIWVTYNEKGTPLAPMTINRACGQGPTDDEQTVADNRDEVLNPPKKDNGNSNTGTTDDTTGNGTTGDGTVEDDQQETTTSNSSKEKLASSTNRKQSDKDTAAGSSRLGRNAFDKIYDSVLAGMLSLSTLAVVAGILTIIVQHALVLAR